MKLLFEDDFLDGLATDPIAGATYICEVTLSSFGRGGDWTAANWANLIEAYVLLSEMEAAKLFPFEHYFPDIPQGDEIHTKCSHAFEALSSVLAKCNANAEEGRLEKLRTKFRIALREGFKYEFSQGDLEKVQTLINELRAEVSASTLLEPEHKARLLKRLEALQAEIHKKISDLDKFWGLIGDASVVMAKIGNNAKPIVDRVREIADIVWRTQTRAEELPSGISLPQIGHAPTAESLTA
ncbi:hypothetical protein [Rhodoferax sp.]|uniref:hypothetical protein n=1 Tax=Rhodoferax sp. TaxID=50421 RepID=UPI0025EC8B1D|nr:hypothetical protein [Rhodoferax sp.]